MSTLIHLRRHLRLTQHELADAIGVPRGAVARWESGARPVPVAHLPALASVLGVASVEHLLALQAFSVQPACDQTAQAPDAEPYDSSSGSLEAMLWLGDVALRLHEDAREAMGSGVYAHFIDVFPRDRPTELLCAHHIAAAGARFLWTSPLQMGCDLLVVPKEGPFAYTGHHLRPALRWTRGDEQLVVFGQVTLAVVAQSRRYRPDFLCCYRRGDASPHWMHIENDGGVHAEQHAHDGRRAAGLGTPEIRFENVVLQRSDFFESRLLRRVREVAQWRSGSPPPTRWTR